VFLMLCVPQVDAERRLRSLAEEQAALTRATVEKEAATAAARAAADEQALLLQVRHRAHPSSLLITSA
jgi:hypothetical protein